MRTLSKLILGSLGLAALGGSALAADRVHVMDVAFPDGTVRQIHYAGTVQPRILVVPVAAPSPAAVADPFEMGDPFAMLDRMTAAMNAQATAMLRQAALAPRGVAAGGNGSSGSPIGSVSYSYTSYSSTADGKGCAQSVQMTSLGSGQAPQVVRRSAGDCSSVASRAPVPAARTAPPVTPSPIVPARYVPAPAKPKPAPVI